MQLFTRPRQRAATSSAKMIVRSGLRTRRGPHEGGTRVSNVIAPYTSVVTLLVVLLYFFIATRVSLARRTFNVELRRSRVIPTSSASFAST